MNVKVSEMVKDAVVIHRILQKRPDLCALALMRLGWPFHRAWELAYEDE